MHVTKQTCRQTRKLKRYWLELMQINERGSIYHMIININNCNNIKSGSLPINSNQLNILFGRNGTGKSTIARAIYLAVHGSNLSELIPYGMENEVLQQSIVGIPECKVAIFDDNYVSQYVYQPDSLIKDAFEVLIRSEEYDETKKNIDDALAKIKTTITDSAEIGILQQHIGVLINNIEFTGSTNKIAKRKGGIKGLLSGKGAYFTPPAELNELKPFFEEDSVSEWAAWRLKGYKEFGSKGRCPYCSTGDTEKTETINKIFSDSFDKASIEYVEAISKAIDALADYLNMDKAKELLSMFGVKQNIPVLETQLAKLGAEARYLHERLSSILSFNSLSVDREGITALEEKLTDMKVDLRACDSYFTSDLTKSEMGRINSEIDSLLGKVNELKGEIGRQNRIIQDRIKDRETDINDFLHLAGFKYSFDVKVSGEGNARALLKYILPDGSPPRDVQSPGKHLSWGEKHSFALILFMFDAIHSGAELVILDDPISSFDSNKKYAIINRLFKTGERGNSFYERTVLMLTHDFEPVIDYVCTSSGRQVPTSVCASYLENRDGQLKCSEIKKEDVLSSVVLFKDMAMDRNLDIATRIGCLRKFLEHQYKTPREESNAYNILSSLLHGRSAPTIDSNGDIEMTSEQVASGVEQIEKYIEGFLYDKFRELFSEANLLERFSNEANAYVKMLILRAYTEANTSARERLRKKNDVLRKYVDETYHIENDYIYSIDIRKFNIVPDNYIADADAFVESEKELLSKS